ncbi:YCF48-related protein, partial [Escherichia coli]|nr:YCF48-related protein [Escherichia coli]
NGSGWIWQNPLPQGNHLNSVRFAPGGRVGFSVGNDGTILWTKDGGFNWQMVEPLINTSFTSVYAIDEQTAIAVGTRGTIIFTENGGREWRFANSEARDHL